MLELVILIAIIGVLSAVVIPIYKDYKEDTKNKVTESILQLVHRTIKLELSLGAQVNQINKDDIWSTIVSTDKVHFEARVYSTDSENTQWCMKVQGLSGGYKSGCVDSTGATVIKNVSAKCTQFYIGYKCRGGSWNLTSNNCPSNCSTPDSGDIPNDSTCTAENENTTQSVVCKNGSHDTAIAKRIGCSEGVCKVN